MVGVSSQKNSQSGNSSSTTSIAHTQPLNTSWKLHTPTKLCHVHNTLTLWVERLQQLVYTYSKTAMNMIGFMSERTRGEPSATDVSANMARNTSHLEWRDIQVGDGDGRNNTHSKWERGRGERKGMVGWLAYATLNTWPHFILHLNINRIYLF